MNMNMSAMIELMTVKPEEIECCICYDIIGKQNNCTTPCGHSFCFECMMKSLGRNNTCPCCRAVLKEDEGESDDEEEYEETVDESDDDEYNREEMDRLASPQVIAERMSNMGYTMADILSLYLNRIDRDDLRYTRAFTNKLVKDFDEVVVTADEEIDNMVTEREEMSGEDMRTRLYKEGTVFDVDPTFTLGSFFAL